MLLVGRVGGREGGAAKLWQRAENNVQMGARLSEPCIQSAKI